MPGCLIEHGLTCPPTQYLTGCAVAQTLC